MARLPATAHMALVRPYAAASVHLSLLFLLLSISFLTLVHNARAEAPTTAAHIFAAAASYSTDDISSRIEGEQTRAVHEIDASPVTACLGGCCCGSSCHVMAQLAKAGPLPLPVCISARLALASAAPCEEPAPDTFRPPIA